MKLLDTNVAVDYLRGAKPAVSLLHVLADSGDVPIASELVRFELLAGAREAEMELVEDFCSGLEWVMVDSDIAKVGGALARRYRPSFSGIEDADYLIAATALLLEAELLTTNVKHFPMFDGLEPAY